MQTKASANYQKTLEACVKDLIEQGGQTVKDISEKCGFKPTHNLRRHLRSMEEHGIVQATEAYTERGNLATFYHKPVPVQNMPLPEMAF